MDRDDLANHQLIVRYLADQLRDDERDAFQAYFLAHPEIVREMEAVARCKVGLAAMDANALSSTLRSPSRGSFLQRHAKVSIGIAACAALIAALTYSLRSPVIGPTVAELNGAFGRSLPTSSTAYTLMRMRSIGVDSRITLPATPSALALRAMLDSDERSEHRIVLSRLSSEGARRVATLSGVRPDDDLYVHFFLDSSKLQPGLYEVAIAPDGVTPGIVFRVEFVAEERPSR